MFEFSIGELPLPDDVIALLVPVDPVDHVPHLPPGHLTQIGILYILIRKSTIRLKTVKTTAVLAFNRLAEQSASAFYKQDCLKQIKIIKKQVALYNAKLLNFTEEKIVIKMRIFLEMEEFVFCNAVKKIVNAIYCFLSCSRYKK